MSLKGNKLLQVSEDGRKRERDYLKLAILRRNTISREVEENRKEDEDLKFCSLGGGANTFFLSWCCCEMFSVVFVFVPLLRCWRLLLLL